MAKKVFIGVGHGGSDPGAVANGFKEKDLNLFIAAACNSELVRHGVTTKMSRTKDENDTLTEEIKECNVFAPDLALDIHNNAGGGDGVEAFYYSGGGTSKTLAQNVIDAITAIGQNSRGIKTRLYNGTDYYGFIRETIAPAIIVECAFLDNAADVKIIDTEAEQKAMGVAIAKGILKTLGIAYKAEGTTNKNTTAATAKEDKTVTINGINIPRNTDYIVLYTAKATTGTNKWGTEVALDANGAAMGAPVYGVGNMAIPAGGYVLSGHGKQATWILENIGKGTKVNINTSITI